MMLAVLATPFLLRVTWNRPALSHLRRDLGQYEPPLVASLLISALSIAVGIAALRSIGRSEGRQYGKGLAIAGIAVGSLWALLDLAVLTFGWVLSTYWKGMD